MRRAPPRQRWEEQGPSKRRIEEDRRGGEFGRGFSSADGDRREGRFDADYPREQVLRDRLVEERNFQREDWERRAPNNREANYNQRFDEFRTSDSEKLFRNGDRIGVGMQRNARIPTIHDRLGEGGPRNRADEGRTGDLLRIAAVSLDPRILALAGGVVRRGIIRRPVPMIHYVSAVKSLVTSQPNVPNTWDAK